MIYENKFILEDEPVEETTPEGLGDEPVEDEVPAEAPAEAPAEETEEVEGEI